MSNVVFLCGRDAVGEVRSDDDEWVSCTVCHRLESQEAIYAAGWEFDPLVCPDCLHWEALPGCDCVPTSREGTEGKMFIFRRYGRFWAVYEGDTLLAVVVYKKGAAALVDRLASLSATASGAEMPSRSERVPEAVLAETQ
jgi:hypothetical protein